MFFIFFASISPMLADEEVEYVQVTDNKQIVDGGVYLLKVENAGRTYYANGFSGANITCDEETTPGNINNPYLLTLEYNDGSYLIKTINKKYLCIDSNLKESAYDKDLGYAYDWSITVVDEQILIKRFGDFNHSLNYSGNQKIALIENGLVGSKIYLYRQVPATPPSVNVEVTAASYATFCCDKALDFTDSGIEAYTATLRGTIVYLEQRNKVPANTGIILFKENGTDGAISISVCDDELEDIEDNCLTATTTAKTVAEGETIYILSTINGETAFYPAAVGLTIPAGKAYIDLSSNDVEPEVNESKRIAVSFSVPTAIKGVSQKNADAKSAAYSINGQKTSATYPGIIIKDGKKSIKMH